MSTESTRIRERSQAQGEYQRSRASQIVREHQGQGATAEHEESTRGAERARPEESTKVHERPQCTLPSLARWCR